MADPFQPKFVDLVRNTITTTGTGNIVLGAAVAGHSSIAAAVAVGERFFYAILGVDKPAEREVGRGTLLANGTIAREPVGSGLTNFTTGTKTIALVVGAEWFNKVGDWINGGAESLGALATVNKSSLVGAVNEVAAAAAAAGGGGGAGSAVAALTFVASAGSVIAGSVNLVDTSGYSVAGHGGARYVYDAAVNAAHVTANPRTSFLAADGRGFRLDHLQRLTLEMFGGRANYVNKSNQGTDSYAAIMAALQWQPVASRAFSPEVHAGVGSYYCSQKLQPRSVFALTGVPHLMANDGAVGFAATRFVFPINTRCVQINSANVTDETVGANLASASMSKVSHICFEQETDNDSNIGTDLSAHAIYCRGAAWIEGCTYTGIAGDGQRFAASATSGGALEGEASNWVAINNYAHLTGGNGHYAFGQDANIGWCQGFRTKTCGLAGIRDDCAFVNVYVQPHLAGYGTGGVQHAGRQWQPINSSTLNDTIHSTTTPGTDSTVWYDRGPLAAPNAAFPAWSSATTYLARGPVISNGAATFSGVYVEGGGSAYGYSHAPNGSVYGSNMGWTHHTNMMASGGPFGMTNTKAVGHYAGTGDDVTHPLFAAVGNAEYTVLGQRGADISDRDKRARIFTHGVSGFEWNWSYEGVVGGVARDIVSRYANRPQWSISGKGTAQTYGRSAAVEGMFTLHDYAIQDSTDSANVRIHGMRIGAPGSGEHARGEFVWNTNPSAAGVLGWSCTTTGTPGTWTAVPVTGFGGSYVGDATFTGTFVNNGGINARDSGSGYDLRMAPGGTAYISNIKDGVGYSDMAFRGGENLLFLGGSTSAPVEVFRANSVGLSLPSGKAIYIAGTKVLGTRGAALPADATDLATALTLINAIKARMVAHGLVA